LFSILNKYFYYESNLKCLKYKEEKEEEKEEEEKVLEKIEVKIEKKNERIEKKMTKLTGSKFQKKEY
jgi:hypothetical protein